MTSLFCVSFKKFRAPIKNKLIYIINNSIDNTPLIINEECYILHSSCYIDGGKTPVSDSELGELRSIIC